jgi:lipopolysaccharide export system ATP-binding protein
MTDRVLDQFGLTHLKKNNAARLSGGEKRRLEIARCLVCDPLLILLDEPFTGLDRASSARLEERLRQLRETGRTCVMATHDQDQGLRVADRVLVLRGGRLELDVPARGLDAARLERLMATSEPAARPGRS